MSPLDNSVLNAIGRLQANDESSQRQREAIFKKLDEIAQSMGDVDPYAALTEFADKLFDAIGKLPNR